MATHTEHKYITPARIVEPERIQGPVRIEVEDSRRPPHSLRLSVFRHDEGERSEGVRQGDLRLSSATQSLNNFKRFYKVTQRHGHI
jgi:hypothetical protein